MYSLLLLTQSFQRAIICCGTNCSHTKDAILKVLGKPVNICNIKGYEMIKALLAPLLQCRSTQTISAVPILQNRRSFRDI